MKGIVDKVKYAIAFLPFLCPFFDSLEHDYLTIALCSMLLLFIAGRCFCSENGSLAISLSDVILGGFIIYISFATRFYIIRSILILSSGKFCCLYCHIGMAGQSMIVDV